MSDRGYSYKSSGTNSQVSLSDSSLSKGICETNGGTKMSAKGNHYCARDYGSSASNSNSYHYSNK
jgi:hypothetical protein